MWEWRVRKAGPVNTSSRGQRWRWLDTPTPSTLSVLNTGKSAPETANSRNVALSCPISHPRWCWRQGIIRIFIDWRSTYECQWYLSPRWTRNAPSSFDGGLKATVHHQQTKKDELHQTTGISYTETKKTLSDIFQKLTQTFRKIKQNFFAYIQYRFFSFRS